jgi:hypothetical protein
MPMKPVFGNLMSKFPSILNIKYQRFNGNERPLDWYNLRPLLVFAGQYLYVTPLALLYSANIVVTTVRLRHQSPTFTLTHHLY